MEYCLWSRNVKKNFHKLPKGRNVPAPMMERSGFYTRDYTAQGLNVALKAKMRRRGRANEEESGIWNMED
jgi:hypothetical protein